MIKVKKFPPLFKKDKTGKIRVVQLTIFKENGNYVIVNHTGILNGAAIPHRTNVDKARSQNNVRHQAYFDARSMWNDKRKKGYKSFEDLQIEKVVLNTGTEYHYKDTVYFNLEPVLQAAIKQAETTALGYLKPALAQHYYRDKKKKEGIRAKFPSYIQPKLNGVRAFMLWSDLENKAIILSKNGIQYNLPFMVEGLTRDVFEYDDEEIIFDGELYIHGEHLQVINSLARKYTLQSHELKFMIFDLAIPNADQAARFGMLAKIAKKMSLAKIVMRSYNMNVDFKGHSNICICPTYIVHSDSEAQEKFQFFLDRGFEGAIVRNTKAEYKFGKRTNNLLKIKKREQAEFVILDVVPMEKAPDQGMFLLRNDLSHETFLSVPIGSREVRAEYLTNKDFYIGKLATVEFYERSAPPKEIPLHSNVMVVRNYE